MHSKFPYGSEWRKWDLHVHLPGTKMADGYRADGTTPLDKFIDDIEASDVAVIGITDYFSLGGFFNLKARYAEKYPDSDKVLLPNIELRLNDTVNREQAHVNLHLLLAPGISQAKASKSSLLNQSTALRAAAVTTTAL
ncbi:MAG: hypothetical protein ACYCPS_02775 [Candidatus Saccharimonadales bacterium]